MKLRSATVGVSNLGSIDNVIEIHAPFSEYLRCGFAQLSEQGFGQVGGGKR